MSFRSTILFLFTIAIAGIITFFVVNNLIRTENSDVETVSAGWLLKNPVYSKQISLWGKVSGIGELYCPCFTIESADGKIEVWYDLMADAQGKTFPRVDIGSLKNGDTVVISGEAIVEPASENGIAFWMKAIDKIEPATVDPLLLSTEVCQDECLKIGLSDGQCKALISSDNSEIKLGSCETSENNSCIAGSDCGCYCRIQKDQPLTAAPPSAVFLLEQLRLKTGIDFPRAHPIELRYEMEENGKMTVKWLKAAESAIPANSETWKTLDAALTELGVTSRDTSPKFTEMENVYFRQRDSLICMIITHDLDSASGNIELQCGVMESKRE